MKRTKRIFAIFMTLALAMSMLIVSSAVSFAEDPTYTITITPNAQDKGTHTYEAYQIFTGKLSGSASEGYTLSDIEWGSGITEAGKTALGNAKAYAEGMTEANAAEKAAELAQYLNTTSGTYAENAISGLTAGYYLVQDAATSPSSTTDETKPAAKTKFILQVVADQTVEVKSSVPTVEKKVKEKNDTTGVETGWQDAADYDIGDIIPYQITATIGSGIDNFSKYSLTFEDDMSKGLTLVNADNSADENKWKVEVVNGDESVDVTSSFSHEEVTTGKKYSDGTKHTWSVTDLKGITTGESEASTITVNENTKVVLTYYAQLNDKAVIGAEGNPNDVVLDFDNNPNNCGNGTPEGKTPEDKNIVFTYEIDALKVEADGEPVDAIPEGADANEYVKVGAKWQKTKALSGAGFTLYKEVKSGDKTEWVQIGEEVTGKTTFDFKGTDAGKYKLVETTVPTGYNKADDVVITVTATYDEVSANPQLKTLSVTPETAGFTATLSSGIVSGKILNEKGANLPSTGGIGTVIFYVLGSLLVVGCGIVLISKRRMESR